MVDTSCQCQTQLTDTAFPKRPASLVVFDRSCVPPARQVPMPRRYSRPSELGEYRSYEPIALRRALDPPGTFDKDFRTIKRLGRLDSSVRPGLRLEGGLDTQTWPPQYVQSGRSDQEDFVALPQLVRSEERSSASYRASIETRRWRPGALLNMPPRHRSPEPPFPCAASLTQSSRAL